MTKKLIAAYILSVLGIGAWLLVGNDYVALNQYVYDSNNEQPKPKVGFE